MNAMTTNARSPASPASSRSPGAPEFHAGLPFCCAGCVVGGPCLCSYDLLEEA